MTAIPRAPLLWTAAAVAVAAELLVGVLALHPRADVPYTAYYIDRSSDCWPHDTPAAYELGTTLSFIYGQPHDFAPNKICGWFYPNEKGTWSYGSFSLLRFAFPPIPGDLRLTLMAGAMVTASDPVQRVDISIGDTLVGTMNFTTKDAAALTIDIPAALAATSDKGLTLRFDYPDARSGQEIGPNEDAHLRAIRAVALTLAAK